MKRPWQFWTLYLISLAIVVSAMTWLTVKALELDRAEALARRQAEMEEDISRALWRMDVKLMPILAKEAARPHSVYRPLLTPPGLGPSQPKEAKLSPLLTEQSDYVLVNFQVDPDNQWSSPQSLTGEIRQIACAQGASPEQIRVCTDRLAALQGATAYDSLFRCLPAESLPDVQTPQQQAQPQPQALAQNRGGKFVQNPSVDLDKLSQQIDDINFAARNSATDADLQQQIAAIPNAYNSGRTQRGQSRMGNDLRNRDDLLQAFTQKEAFEQRLNWSSGSDSAAREGVSQPVWVGSQLLLARRVETDGKVLIQGCWLDWPKIRKLMIAEVAELLPGVDLEPVSDPAQVKVSRMLATLPVQLVVPSPDAAPATWSAMRIALLTAWGCLLIAAVAAGVLLHGVLQLSERRGAFVSAVTHELRTPLTTFRMYSEMLAQDMVPDADKRRLYLNTLRVEADRLWHLVENVLSYARLERGRHRRSREQLTVGSLIDRVQQRFEERATQAEMKLVVEADGDARDAGLNTDPAAVEQILFNLVDNACKYAASSDDRRIHLRVVAAGGSIRLQVRDHGTGIASHDAKRLFRPFSKSADEAADSAPGVGLGLALCRRLAAELGGRLELDGSGGDGATFVLTLPATCDS